MHDEMSLFFVTNKLVFRAPWTTYSTSHVPEISVSVDLKSISNRFIVFWNDDKIPRLKFITQFGSSVSGHSSPIIPSWYENLES